MDTLKLLNHSHGLYTQVSNDFIDFSMAGANGEYVKVYLLLLRYMNGNSSELSISFLADKLEMTEKDITRAIRYWAKEELFTLHFDNLGNISEIIFGSAPEHTPDGHDNRSHTVCADDFVSADNAKTDSLASEPKAADHTSGSASSIRQFKDHKNRKELKQLLFIAENYIGKTLTKSEMEAVSYFYEDLGFSADLVEYLIEYCVENGHKSMHYIQSVALSWAEQKITTVSEAKNASLAYNKECYRVLNAFGIKGRSPVGEELDFIRKWLNEDGFSLDLIEEACCRTISAIHQPKFSYANTILENWRDKGVHHLEDVEKLDDAYRKSQTQKRQPTACASGKTKFSNFEERSYDMEDLERQLLSN